jgi:hypothetical protein
MRYRAPQPIDVHTMETKQFLQLANTFLSRGLTPGRNGRGIS